MFAEAAACAVKNTVTQSGSGLDLCASAENPQRPRFLGIFCCHAVSLPAKPAEMQRPAPAGRTDRLYFLYFLGV